MSKTRTTAGELIAMLSELNPDTHVYVDIGSYDWEESDAIELRTNQGRVYGNKNNGDVHLTGLKAEDVEWSNTIEGEAL
ncbi:hypothetical protein [Glutamicibacter sp. AOP5-A2-18]|uniref:hypothetical protein n=1 Tax=Glutamicibacter sp. AOP5-A2-18 TaxID=3457656 RepID=UPI0040343BFD